jgi:hypothetical protein
MARFMSNCSLPQHFLYFLPLPQGHLVFFEGSLPLTAGLFRKDTFALQLAH